MNTYENCPVFDSDNFIIRLIENDDYDALLKVYSDKNALPFFNSDNCDGDNFYYDTIKKMKEVLAFWQTAFDNGWFTRLSIVDKITSEVIGTVELCLHVSEDAFNNTCILRVDVRSDYEREDALFEIFSLLTPKVEKLVGGKGVITKAPIYAIERINALKKAGYKKSDNFLIGKSGYKYGEYWITHTEASKE